MSDRRPLRDMRLRAFFWSYIARYCCEICRDCGRRVGAVWWADPPDWAEITQGQWGPGGLLCQGCFTSRARKLGILLVWHPHVQHRKDDNGEWQDVPSHIQYEDWTEYVANV